MWMLLGFQALLMADITNNISPNLQAVFVDHVVLSPSEISNALILAKKCGLQNPVRISTGYCLPTRAYFIEVKDRESISGRRIKYLSVVINHEKTEEQKLFSLGKFWVGSGDIWTNEFATFKIKDQTIRVRMPHTLSLDTADRIITAFSTKRVLYDKNDLWWGEFKPESFSAPDSLEGPDENGVFKAVKGDLSGFVVEFKLKGDAVKIIRIGTFVT